MLELFGDPLIAASVLYPEKWQGIRALEDRCGSKGTVQYLPATSAWQSQIEGANPRVL
jgi:hypothetical protein